MEIRIHALVQANTTKRPSRKDLPVQLAISSTFQSPMSGKGIYDSFFEFFQAQVDLVLVYPVRLYVYNLTSACMDFMGTVCDMSSVTLSPKDILETTPEYAKATNFAVSRGKLAISLVYRSPTSLTSLNYDSGLLLLRLLST